MSAPASVVLFNDCLFELLVFLIRDYSLVVSLFQIHKLLSHTGIGLALDFGAAATGMDCEEKGSHQKKRFWSEWCMFHFR